MKHRLTNTVDIFHCGDLLFCLRPIYLSYFHLHASHSRGESLHPRVCGGVFWRMNDCYTSLRVRIPWRKSARRIRGRVNLIKAETSRVSSWLHPSFFRHVPSFCLKRIAGASNRDTKGINRWVSGNRN